MKRKGNESHYERALEKYFRVKGILYIAVDEAKRPIHNRQKWKNFDFLVFSEKHFILMDVKGKKFPYKTKKNSMNFWENWIGDDDIKYMNMWKNEISFTRAKAIFCFSYWLNDPSAIHKIKGLSNFQGVDQRNFTIKYGKRKYALLTIQAEVYDSFKKRRSKKPPTSYVSRDEFKNRVYPISKYLN